MTPIKAPLVLLAVLSSLSKTAFGHRKPHILHVIVDDYGWGNANYHRDVADPEVGNLSRAQPRWSMTLTNSMARLCRL